MDVNDIARQCLEQTRLREAEYQKNLEIAKQNEKHMESELRWVDEKE